MILPSEIDRLVRPLLREGETPLWHGAPLPGLHQPGKAALLAILGLPFLLVGTGLVIDGVTRIAAHPWSSDGALGLFFCSLAFVFAGLGGAMVFGPWIEGRMAGRLHHYVLTNRAAFIVTHILSGRVRVYPILPPTALELEIGRYAGSVWLHAQRERDSDGNQTVERAGFRNIADAEGVFRLVRDIQEGAKA